MSLFHFCFHSNKWIVAPSSSECNIYCETWGRGRICLSSAEQGSKFSASQFCFNAGNVYSNPWRANGHIRAHTYIHVYHKTRHVLWPWGQWYAARVAGARRDLTLSLFILFKRIKLFSSKLKFETKCLLRAKRPPWRKEVLAFNMQT